MFAKRVDKNHAEIREAFREMLGDHVTDSSGWGNGAGDLFVSSGHFACFIEIKADEKKKTTAAQDKFRERHPEQWFRCNSVVHAIYLCKHIRAMGSK